MTEYMDAERDLISAAGGARKQCVCGDGPCDGAVTAEDTVRMRAYLAAHPGHQFAYDDDGAVGVIAPGDSGVPDVIAASYTMRELLDLIGAPDAGQMS